MTIKKKGVSTTDNAPKNSQGNIKPKPPTKQEISLLTLLKAGSSGLNALEANKLYGDTALHSMISIFRNHFGLIIGGEHETIVCRVGTPTTFVRYRLVDDSSVKASKKLIDYWRKKRNAPPLFNSK